MRLFRKENRYSLSFKVEPDPLDPNSIEQDVLVTLTDFTGELTPKKIDIIKSLLSAQTSRYSPQCLEKVEVLHDIVSIYFKDAMSASFFLRSSMSNPVYDHAIQTNSSTNNREVMKFSLNRLSLIIHFDMIKKFDKYTDSVTEDHLSGLGKISKIIDLAFSDFRFEARYKHYSEENGPSGPLKSVMLKFNKYPNSKIALIKTTDDFKKHIIERLQEKLGNGFPSLVLNYGDAIDGSCYVNVDAEELKLFGANKDQSNSFGNCNHSSRPRPYSLP